MVNGDKPKKIELAKGWAHVVNERDGEGKALNETLPAFPKEWKKLEILFNKKNISRKECILLPFKTLAKALKT